MNYKDLWLSHSHRINADDSEKYMDEEDFKIAILEWESAKTVSRVELPVGVPSRTNSETLLECNMENKYSIEPHGDGYAIYYGRCMHRHGYNLAHLTECEEKFIKIIEEALNEKSVKP